MNNNLCLLSQHKGHSTMRFPLRSLTILLCLAPISVAGKPAEAPDVMKGTPCENYTLEEQKARLAGKTPTGNWASTNDYPSKALNQGREGTATFKVLIGPDGFVKSCAVLKSSGHKDLDEATCKTLTKRARFSAARDDNGNAIDGCFAGDVAYRLPRE
jgi:periplasmic protein TonB